MLRGMADFNVVSAKRPLSASVSGELDNFQAEQSAPCISNREESGWRIAVKRLETQPTGHMEANLDATLAKTTRRKKSAHGQRRKLNQKRSVSHY